MTTYTVLQCMTSDCVTSKPLLGVAGLVTVVMAMFSGFGLPMYLGLSWQAINMVAIFLTLGIGLDSVFLSGILERELVNNIQESSMALEVLPLTVLVMTTYTVLQCMTSDCVTSKPLLG